MLILFLFIYLLLIHKTDSFLPDLSSNSIEIDVAQGLTEQFEIGLPERNWDQILFCGQNTLYLSASLVDSVVVHKYTITGQKLQFVFGRLIQNGIEVKPNPSCTGYAVRMNDLSIEQFQNGNEGALSQRADGPCDSFIINTDSEIDCFTSATNDAVRYRNSVKLFSNSFGLLLRKGTSIQDKYFFETGEKKGDHPQTQRLLTTLEITDEEILRFFWAANTVVDGPDEDVSHILEFNGNGIRKNVFHSPTTSQNNKWFNFNVGPNAKGVYKMFTRCDNRNFNCDWLKRGIMYGYEYNFRENFPFGCIGKSFKLVGNARILTCPGFSHVNGIITSKFTNNFVLFDSNMTFLDDAFPASAEGSGISLDKPLAGEKMVVSKLSKIYATQLPTNKETVHLKLYFLLGESIQRKNGFVYDTGRNNIDDFFLVADANDESDIIYLIDISDASSTKIRVLQPFSNTKAELLQILEAGIKGTASAFGAKFETGSFIVAVAGETGLKGFVSEKSNENGIDDGPSNLIFLKYPSNLVPSTFTDFLEFAAVSSLTEDEQKLDITTLITQKITDKTFKGYITKGDDVVSTLKARGKNPSVIGPLSKVSGSHFYETLPPLTHFFGYNPDPQTCIPNYKYCLYTASNEGEARSLCLQISRCEGYVGNCLIEAFSYPTCKESTILFYNKKKYRHRVFVFIEEQSVPIIIGSICIAIGHFYYLYRIIRHM